MLHFHLYLTKRLNKVQKIEHNFVQFTSFTGGHKLDETKHAENFKQSMTILDLGTNKYLPSCYNFLATYLSHSSFNFRIWAYLHGHVWFICEPLTDQKLDYKICRIPGGNYTLELWFDCSLFLCQRWCSFFLWSLLISTSNEDARRNHKHKERKGTEIQPLRFKQSLAHRAYNNFMWQLFLY